MTNCDATRTWSGDREACRYLGERGYVLTRGIIVVPPGHRESPTDASAINYLCGDWDYAMEAGA